jgi:hypothetical protein
MKRVLVIYYTQTGQLNRALRATLAPLENRPDVSLHYELLKPVTPFPYPWSYVKFFDTFPETVQGVPCELEPLSITNKVEFDLIVVGYQPWFLSVCIPVNSFLKSELAKKIMCNKPVVTVIACRNMWLNAQEKMKRQLQTLEANLVGNITFVDKAANLVSLVTVLAFVLKGVQNKYLGIFPKYGVDDADLQERAPKYGETLLKHLQSGNYNGMQTTLNNQGAVTVKPNLMLMEGRGAVMFPLYANYISKKGAASSQERKTRVKVFGVVLPTAILILSPFITIASRLAPILLPKKMKKEIAYWSQNTLR